MQNIEYILLFIPTICTFIQQISMGTKYCLSVVKIFKKSDKVPVFMK